MSAASVDTEQERGQAVTALIASYSRPASPPWPSCNRQQSSSPVNRHDLHHDHEEFSRDASWTSTAVESDAPAGAADQRLGLDPPQRAEEGPDMCSSTWKSVESMARMLAAGQSVVSTISKCHSLPGLGTRASIERTSERGAHGRGGRSAPTEADAIHTALVSERLVAEALAVFRRLGQAPLTQPDSLYMNSSKMPEAVKALDPGLDDATISAWMATNGFEQTWERFVVGSSTDVLHCMHLRAVYLKEHEAASVEALSWTEYWRALSELCPAFRRYGISTIASTALDGYRSRGSASRTRSPLRQQSTLLDHRYRDPWEVVVERGYTDPTAHLEEERGGPRGLTRGGRVGAGGGGSDSLPRSPGADSFHVLRRKRHAAVALDYESATKELPQVMPKLDPSILVDHIKAQGRRDRKHPESDGGGSSLRTLDPHERLLKMSLQKSQVSETANPRIVQPRHAAVRIRSRRNEFYRRREAEAGLITRISRNVGVIGRHASVAEAKANGAERNAADQTRVEGQREAETRRAALVKLGAAHRARNRRAKMETLKACIAVQLRTIQENEVRALERVREKRNVLRKGKGVDTTDLMRRSRSSPTLRRNEVESIRQPRVRPTVPPSDQDARWIYSSGAPGRTGTSQKRRIPVGADALPSAPLLHSTPSATAIALAPQPPRGVENTEAASAYRESCDVRVDGEGHEHQVAERAGAKAGSIERAGAPGRNPGGGGLSLPTFCRAGRLPKKGASIPGCSNASKQGVDAGSASPWWGSGPSLSPWCRQVASPMGWDMLGNAAAPKEFERTSGKVVNWGEP